MWPNLTYFTSFKPPRLRGCQLNFTGSDNFKNLLKPHRYRDLQNTKPICLTWQVPCCSGETHRLWTVQCQGYVYWLWPNQCRVWVPKLPLSSNAMITADSFECFPSAQHSVCTICHATFLNPGSEVTLLSSPPLYRWRNRLKSNCEQKWDLNPDVWRQCMCS